LQVNIFISYPVSLLFGLVNNGHVDSGWWLFLSSLLIFQILERILVCLGSSTSSSFHTRSLYLATAAAVSCATFFAILSFIGLIILDLHIKCTSEILLEDRLLAVSYPFSCSRVYYSFAIAWFIFVAILKSLALYLSYIEWQSLGDRVAIEYEQQQSANKNNQYHILNNNLSSASNVNNDLATAARTSLNKNENEHKYFILKLCVKNLY